MRAKIAIGLLILFCTVELSSLLPYAQYYLNYDYISEVLCINKEQPMTMCYGKCYLSDQLNKATNRDDGGVPNPQVEWQKQPLTLNNMQQYSLIAFKEDLTMKHFEFATKLQNRHTQPPTPPPEC
ncbi:MAG: hypothetical protein AAFO69_02080 [Bacteroidota bacterium]